MWYTNHKSWTKQALIDANITIHTMHGNLSFVVVCDDSCDLCIVWTGPVWKFTGFQCHVFSKSLLEYKARNVKLAAMSVWSDLIHVTLWRNDGSSHSFSNFSRSTAFGENFIGTKFIFHKIFFRLSHYLETCTYTTD